ncbi:MAG: energy transducer TonB [Bacteroidetes bacterium]|nr:energy transducer TonB [Bacteroidota bacterium]
MTHKEIAQARLLDILFENRNKEYGAYALRQGYNKRMLIALGAGVSVIALFVLFKSFSGSSTAGSNEPERKAMVIREYVMPPDKPKEPEKPKETPKPKTPVKAQAIPKVATVQFTSPPKITDNVKNPMPPVDVLPDKKIGTINTPGTPDSGLAKIPVRVPENGGGTGKNAGPSQPEPAFTVQEKDPEFPGGPEALKKFLSRYLNTPSELESGETKVVRVRFKVDKDGSVNAFEIMTSGGGEFDNEVLRVCKKMPRWIPAIQNGTHVPVSYVLPVTFIGLEE